ncbi:MULTISPECIES: hypothetical protein [unclassified Streptomyces]|uniref:hypothetical protein n=1 Tax=unclassified Streptomyces TaxID=2593676 RepID=UPI0022552526|nr:MULTISPECIES: hypothetical protein [unclassified Streptomyces]MCX5328817.1 hypothetical protein [Streptomyces sp. NBC_00140]MCX5358227.1 hypothetical protein [Streptomyces sp. NBC_00124]
MRTVLPALRGCLPTLLVHLLIGVPAAVAILCTRWYIAYGHCEYADLGRGDLDGCTYDQIENGGFALIAMILFGVLVLLLLLLFDVLRPLYRGRPLTPRLLTLPALLIPYAVYVMNGGW